MRQDQMEPYAAENCLVTEQYITVDENVELRVLRFYQPKTSNPPVLFIAGWITRLPVWKEVLRELTRNFSVDYVETREKKSAKTPAKADYSVKIIAHDIAGLVSHLYSAKENYILFGSSLGATAILEAFHLLPRPPKAMVLVAPNAEFRLPRWGRLFVRVFYPGFYLVLKPLIKWYLRLFRLDLNYDFAQYEKYCKNLDAADPWKLKKAMLAFSQYKVWNRLGKINAPTLIIGASKDKLHEPQNIEKMQSMIPRVVFDDLETNRKTHSAEMVRTMQRFIKLLDFPDL
ncbi:hypothetical protein GF407_03910 [candidate division KSB1 bacterium]|nr:hypothetical protein [candidate division KSB1 bacterium]